MESNADRIRAMSDGELASFICDIYDEDEHEGKYICGVIIPAYKVSDILEWLRQTAKED